MRCDFDKALEIFTKAEVVVGHLLEHLNDGHLWYMVGVIPGLAAGAKVYRGFRTPAAGMIYMRPAMIFTTKSACMNFLYEDTSFSGGTPIVPLNRNRNSIKVPLVTIDKLTTPGTLGNLVAWIRAGIAGNAGQGSGGFGADQADDLLLKKDTNYVFEAHNIGAEATDIYYFHSWHVEDDIEGVVV